MGCIIFIDWGNQNKYGLFIGWWDCYDWVYIFDSIIDVYMKCNLWDVQIEVFEKLWLGEDYLFIIKFKEVLNELVW